MPLTVVPTPIGNLEDITLRALRILSVVDLVACEDTRRTGRLLAHHGIENALVAYHEHNEERLAPELAERARTENVALVAYGLPAVTVVFLGFLPRKGRERTELLARIARERSTFVLFESPHRLAKTLGELPAEAPVAVCRELTKLHEEVFRGTAGEAERHFAGRTKGEIVLVVRGGKRAGIS